MYSLILVALLLLSGTNNARRWRGGGHGGGGHGGGGPDAQTTTTTTSSITSDPRDTIQKLMQNRGSVERNVVNTDKGVSTFAKGTTDEMTDWIYQHVEEMKALTESGGSIRNWDELFQKLFQHSNDVHLECSNEGGGITCEHTGDTQCAIDLVQAHAQVVSLFIENGPQEIQKNHGDYVSGNC
jgi:hypothetical protein